MPIKRKINKEISEEIILPDKKNNQSKAVRVLVVLLIFALVGLVAVIVSYWRVSSQVARLATVEGQKEVNKKQIDEVVEKVKKLIILPVGETPTMATITDAAGLSKTQPFYVGANDGDKVLIYFKAQKAYIYNPTKDLLVNVGPVYIENNASSTSASTTAADPTKLLNIEIRNGSEVNGGASTLASQLKKTPSFSISLVDNASTSTYKGIILVDLTSGAKASLVQALEKELNIKSITSLPAGEKKSVAEVVVIVGKQ
ncbi:MAG: hypothetical protein COU31_03675 [Candidatus Magasanikbacteria bacterium CG10_big_fil_rev_8_21_14_0_10_40_10]|uniref:Uncharacterized protein n=1 Tax=Candidatus Magasanikbacteria bacterium CG10_big_fil_rev_8_21_14_0_10_40_10 TaxID=1974648 RepID=A0A2M6W3B6_9BACT|nr:MAG: hypothetical protein COU31_03675 [Candidatus Magasanikbacteria bacterium CG10_big_fil_rev_8_21_14_0_10_40_10]